MLASLDKILAKEPAENSPEISSVNNTTNCYLHCDYVGVVNRGVGGDCDHLRNRI